ncbi:MAG: PDZ domain-containing protein [Proteobacteria bacterium]|nr:PDZ domain-containing protein [Pseudomonadota bacterium]
MNKSGQALLWDDDAREYIVVRVGSRLRHFEVTSIERDQVVLTHAPTRQHFVLPRTSDTSELKGLHRDRGAKGADVSARNTQQGSEQSVRPGSRLSDRYSAGQIGPNQTGQTKGLVDPYATKRLSSTTSSSVLDPYSARSSPSPTSTLPESSRSGSSSVKPGSSSGRTVVVDPYKSSARPGLNSSSDEKAILDPYTVPNRTLRPSVGHELPAPSPDISGQNAQSGSASHPGQVTAVIRSQPGKGKIGEEHRTISRRAFDTAITDFNTLAEEVQASFTAEGVRIDRIDANSFAYRIGFRAGDVVLGIDGHKLRGIDDAAAIYARLVGAKKFAAVVRRGGDMLELHYRFTN